jgi:Ca2+-binding EF-hand superfamily protein
MRPSFLLALLLASSFTVPSLGQESEEEASEGGQRIQQARRASQAISRETTDYDVERLLEHNDTNKDGKIGKEDGGIRPLLARYFDDFDTNSDGFLDKAELKKTDLRPYGGKMFLEAFDKDADGVLTKAEAVHRTLARDFERLDTDNSGTLSQAEMDEMRGGLFRRPQGAQGGFRGGGFGGGFGGRGNPVARAMDSDTNDDGKLSKDEANELVNELFEILDTDKDGFASRAELQANSRLLGVGRFADVILRRADTDGDGQVAKEEAMELADRNPLKNRFDESDANKDGYLTKAEFIQEFARRGVGTGDGGWGNRAGFLLQRGDSDGDGKISEEEFSKLPFLARLGGFDDLDSNDDGFLDGDEFGDLADRLRNASLGRIFDRDDSDRDGFVTRDEATRTLKEYFDTLDADGDGRVSRAEHRERNALMQLRMNEERLGRRLIGVQLEDAGDEPGLRVVQVTTGARAAEAGIQVDDRILSINGESVDAIESLRDAINSGAAKLNIRLVRSGDEHEVEITFE